MLKLLPIVLLLVAVPPRAGEVAIKARRIITVSGAEIENGVILIVEGRIKAVGKDVAIPKDALVVEADVVMPGLVNASAWYGMSGRATEETREVTPEMRSLDEIKEDSADFKRAVQQGITTVHVGPSDRNVIGGLGSVLKTVGGAKAARIVSEDMSLKATVGPSPTRGNYPPRGTPPQNFFARRPTTRMGVTWEFRRAFLEARKYREQGTQKDEAKEVLLRALDRKLTMRVAASRATDIEAALALCDEFGLRFVLEEADEAYVLAAQLAKRDIPVLLRPSYLTRTIYSRDGSEERFSAFAALLEAGVKTALLPVGTGESEGPLATAAFAFKYGATREQVVRAITLTPAELLGVADRVGSIAEGRDADLLLLNGDPLDVKTRIERVLIGGKVFVGKNLSEY